MSSSTTQVPACLPLNRLAGHWSTSGRMLDDSGATFAGVDTYEWVAGGHFLLHRWNVEMPTGTSEGIEVIGHDAGTSGFFVRAYDNSGEPSAMSLTIEGDTLLITGDTMRFSGQFVDGGATVEGTWQLQAPEGSEWSPWMHLRLARSDRTD